jgi:hypothetical protein
MRQVGIRVNMLRFDLGNLMTKNLAAAVWLMLCSSAFSPAAEKPSECELAATTERGRSIKEYDVASWHATDAFLASKPAEGSTRYYLAKKGDSGWTVVFGKFNVARDRFLLVHEAVQGSRPEDFSVVKHDPPVEDAGFYLAAAKATEKALADFPLEKPSYNTYVLSRADGQLYVYLLPATSATDVYLLGGDIRYLFSADGNTILDRHPMHKTIFTFDTNQKPKDAKKIAGVHTHVLTSCPEDSDVFYVLSRKPSMPEIVVTGEHEMYLVLTDGVIERRER